MAFGNAGGWAVTGFNAVREMTKVKIYEKGMEEFTRWGHWNVTHDVVFDPITKNPIECHKDITVNPDASLSAQVHWGRGEHYTGLEGETHVYVNGQVFRIKKGESVVVPRGSIHFSWNESKEKSKFHEIQQGPLCDEMDIKRCADKYKKPHELNSDDDIIDMLINLAEDRYYGEDTKAGFVGQDWMNEVITQATNADNPQTPFADMAFVDELRSFFGDLIKKCKDDHARLTPARPMEACPEVRAI